MPDTKDFFEGIALTADFAALSDPDQYDRLPDDWIVGVADIVGSTKEIAAGRYKTVNMVGAAVISAQINAAPGNRIPFVFGGDGAGFAFWPEQRAKAEAALDAVRSWARDEFGIQLRAATVPVADIRKAGHDIRVARLIASDGVDYAMFSGGGVAWAESQMKAGAIQVPETGRDVLPDLTGLSCRWSNVTARNGTILSLVVEPRAGVSDRDFAKVAQEVIAVADKLTRAGHPMPLEGPGFRFPPDGLELDAHVSRQGRPLWWQKSMLYFGNALLWVLFKSNMRLGKFRPQYYREMTARNADFRKFDDGLKMTLDCDTATCARIKSVLEEAQSKGLVRFGIHEQDQAMMTCFVPSAVEDTHVHFVDGAAGGYASAAAQIH